MLLERKTLCFSIGIGACERKKNAFFVTFILFEGNFVFFNVSVLSQWIVYWIKFQSIYLFTYQKALLHTLLCLFLKIAESLQCILKFQITEDFIEGDAYCTLNGFSSRVSIFKTYCVFILGHIMCQCNSSIISQKLSSD